MRWSQGGGFASIRRRRSGNERSAVMPSPQAQPHMATSRERPKGRDLAELGRLWPFVRPYRWCVVGAVGAALVAAAMVLALGRGIGVLIDQGFGRGDARLLDHALVAIIIGTVVLSAATFARVSLVSWLGERVVADLRRWRCGTCCC